MVIRQFVVSLILLASVCAYSDSFLCEKVVSQIQSAAINKRADVLFKIYWQQAFLNSPEMSTYYGGHPELEDKWTDNSIKAIEERKKQAPCFLQAAKSVDPKSLSNMDRVSLHIMIYSLQQEIKGQKFPAEYLVIDQMGGPQSFLADMMEVAPKNNLKDYENRIARLEKFPVLAEQWLVLLKLGLEKGVTPPKEILSDIPRQFAASLTDQPKESAIYRVFQEMRIGTDEEKIAMQKKALTTIETFVYPALKKIRDFVINEYIPHCRTTLAMGDLPNGKNWYQFSAEAQTTVELTAEQIHQLGLSEVRRLRTEMEKLKQRAKFNGTLKEFDHFLQTDEQFYYSNPKDLLDGYRVIAKKIDPELPLLFGHLPRLTYGVREIPSYKSETSPAAYYQGGSLLQGRAGFFEANTSNLKARAKWAMEALTLHEAVPGHHLQISLAQEFENLPDFRKHGGFTAYTEGWGLYAETLGYELGMYKDIYSEYGQLNFEIWRAIRLVVDTGIHAKGWSRQKAIDFFKDNSAFSEKHILDEVNRYVAWPGQALAYKIGQLKFKELRERAHKKLGSKFSVRDYHDFILSLGSVPMKVLETEFDLWLENKTKVLK